MAEGERELTFVVAGAPPAALAVAAARVRTIVSAATFAGTALDLHPLLSAGSPDRGTHVIVLRRERDELGLYVSGELKMLTLEADSVLPLPAVVRRRSGLSHVLAPRGVPLVFALDLARLDAPGTLRCPWEAGVAPMEK